MFKFEPGAFQMDIQARNIIGRASRVICHYCGLRAIVITVRVDKDTYLNYSRHGAMPFEIYDIYDNEIEAVNAQDAALSYEWCHYGGGFMGTCCQLEEENKTPKCEREIPISVSLNILTYVVLNHFTPGNQIVIT